MHMRYGIAVSVVLATGCGFPPPPSEKPPTEEDFKACGIDADGEKTPGYPFKIGQFQTDIYPLLESCGGSSCHQGPEGAGNYSVYFLGDDCDKANTFSEFRNKVDLDEPEKSRVYVAAADQKSDSHPYGFANADDVTALLDYIEDAQKIKDEDAPSEPDPTEYFDLAGFQSDIRPIFANATCDREGGCHRAPSAPGGFTLNLDPAADSPEMTADFEAVKKAIDLDLEANTAAILRKATASHGGGSTTISQAQTDVLLKWIEDAKAKYGTPPDSTDCTPAANFNRDVFEDEILPILFGDRDLNDRDDGRSNTGCARSTCHGDQHSASTTFHLSNSRSVEENLQAFACVVQPDNPSVSQVLMCPIQDSRCRKNPHPGQKVFENPLDLNYQRILSFLYASNKSASPLDFGFYARKIDPIFNDLNAVEDGLQNRTCADTGQCHGVQIAGSTPPNGSNFPILPEQGNNVQGLQINFASAANFTFFQDARQSSLFLYPTNEIANKDNPLATGFDHKGGEDFAVDSEFAQLILKWAGGIRTDADGFLRDWMIGGDFLGVDEINDDNLLPTAERDIRPKIFDDAGGAREFNNGRWDFLNSDQAFVDLNGDGAFERAAPVNRIAYAATYIVNISGQTVNAQITVTSPNEVQLFVDDQASAPGTTASLLVRIPAYEVGQKTVRVLVKVFQQDNDAEFGFNAQFVDDDNQQPLDDDLVFKTVPEGGI